MMLANQGIYPPNGAAPPAGKVQLYIRIEKSVFFVQSSLRNNIIIMSFVYKAIRQNLATDS